MCLIFRFKYCWSSEIFLDTWGFGGSKSYSFCPRPVRCFPVFTPLDVPSIFTRNPSWCVRTLHFFNCYHHPSNNMLHGFTSLQEGFCPLSPAVTIPVDSHSPHFLCLFPQKEPFAWTETAHHITSCQVERCIAAETCHCWCLNCPSGSPLASQTLVSEIHDSKLLGTIFGQSRMISHPAKKKKKQKKKKMWVRSTNRGRQPAA